MKVCQKVCPGCSQVLQVRVGHTSERQFYRALLIRSTGAYQHTEKSFFCEKRCYNLYHTKSKEEESTSICSDPKANEENNLGI